jgi:hypothetical protein
MAGNIEKVLALLLRPAVLLALRAGLKLQDVLENLKVVFVEVAEEQLKRAGESQSKSKIAVMTGLQRREITRLLETDDSVIKSTNILIKIIGQWGGDKRFSKAGSARDLTFEGVQSEFFELVQSVSKDLNPYTLLFELERLGAVERRGSLITLKISTYDVRHSPEQGWVLWSQDVEDLVFAVEENVSKNEHVPNLHIGTRYDNIVKEEMPAIRRWILSKGAEFHAQVRAHLSQFDKDLNPALFEKEGGGKIIVNSFSRSVIEHVSSADLESAKERE